jgi:hypothetical protein
LAIFVSDQAVEMSFEMLIEYTLAQDCSKRDERYPRYARSTSPRWSLPTAACTATRLDTAANDTTPSSVPVYRIRAAPSVAADHRPPTPSDRRYPAPKGYLAPLKSFLAYS